MTKFCPKCKQTKQITDFSTRKDRGGYQDKCKTCHSKYRREHYLKNKSKYIQKAAKLNAKNKNAAYEVVNELKKQPCTDCGKSFHPYAMDFDHIDSDEKTNCISQMISRGLPIDAIISEIKKCELVCAVCHRMRTYIRRQLSAARGSRTLD